jgi:hypothetical protein
LTSSFFGANAAVINAAGGGESQTLSIANINSFSFTPTVASFSLNAQTG